MKTHSISPLSQPSRTLPVAPVAQVDNIRFSDVLKHAQKASEAVKDPDGRLAAQAQQLFADALESNQKKKKAASTPESSEADADLSSPSKLSPTSILKGIFEETGGPSQKASDLFPKQYAGFIPQETQRTKPVLLAQAQNGQQNAPEQRTQGPFNRRTPNRIPPQTRGLTTTPFQIFLDKAVDFFEMVSQTEEKSDLLVKDFIDGKATIEEVSVARAKMSIAVTFAMTLVNQVVQSFKEIQNMQV
jgi:flagellar hook-basal body complex protein FliE